MGPGRDHRNRERLVLQLGTNLVAGTLRRAVRRDCAFECFQLYREHIRHLPGNLISTFSIKCEVNGTAERAYYCP